jgi:hypothetical protein
VRCIPHENLSEKISSWNSDRTHAEPRVPSVRELHAQHDLKLKKRKFGRIQKTDVDIICFKFQFKISKMTGCPACAMKETLTRFCNLIFRKMIYPTVGNTFYVKLESFYSCRNSLREAKKMYPDVQKIVVKAEIVACDVSIDEITVCFPDILKVYRLQAGSYLKKCFVLSNEQLVARPHLRVLSMQEFCETENVNVYTACSRFYTELQKFKQNGAKLINSIRCINADGKKCGSSVSKSFNNCLRAHLLVPLPAGEIESARQSIISAAVVMSDLGSSCSILNTICAEVASVIRDPMKNRFRISGQVKKTLLVPANFFVGQFCKYLMVSGFVKDEGFVTRDYAVVERAFGGAENQRHLHDPFLLLQCTQSEEEFDLQKQVNEYSQNGINDNLLVRDPRKAKKAEVWKSFCAETGVLNADNALEQTWPLGKLVNELIQHRYLSGTYLGFRFVSLLKVDDDHPFILKHVKARGGNVKIVLTFTISKMKAVFTAGQQPVLEQVW